jgi:hypothetical protein
MTGRAGLPAAIAALPEPLPLRVRWTAGRPPLTLPRGPAGRLLRQNELNAAVRRGAEALLREELAVAERELGTAVHLARELGDEAALDRLRQLVGIEGIEDAAAGRGRLRAAPSLAAINHTLLSSSYHRLPPEDADSGGSGGGPPVRCPRGRHLVPPGRFCERCGVPLDGVR